MRNKKLGNIMLMSKTESKVLIAAANNPDHSYSPATSQELKACRKLVNKKLAVLLYDDVHWNSYGKLSHSFAIKLTDLAVAFGEDTDLS